MDDSSRALPYEPDMLAPRLIALRKALGVSKAEFADVIGLDRSSYTKIEKGAKPLLPYSAYRIFERYGVDMNFIYLGQVGGLPSDLSKKLIAALSNAD